MKKHLLPENGSFYKANLHCHSNLSDGCRTPEELKSIYKKAGYSVIAITDHEGIFDHSYLNDENFLTVPGYERELNDYTDYDENRGWDSVRTTHLCIYPKDPKNLKCVAADPEFIHPKFKWMNDPETKATMEYIGEPFYFTPSVENVNHVIAEANKHGFLVTFNHPQWSEQPYETFSKYKGMFAMEVHNTGCDLAGFNDNNSVIYDMMLRSGHKIFCIAADDNHNYHPDNSIYSDSLGGWVMIKAEALTHQNIIKALEKGNFYSSTGPEIKELYIEDNAVHITCSPAARIKILTGNRFTRSVLSNYGDLTDAKFDLPNVCGYFRLEVWDIYGKKAFTNAFFIE